MTDRELMQKALEALENAEDQLPKPYSTDAREAITALRERLREPEMQVIDEMAEVPWDKLRERLAQPEPAPGYCKHCKQYTIEEPLRTHWEGCEEVHPECKKTVMAEYKFQTYAAYKADGEMKIGVVRMKPVPLHPNLPTPTTAFGNPAPIAQYYTCPHCNKPSPLVREWVGLTQEDWLALGCKTNEEIRVGLAIQAKLKEKNT